jgi:hypothetical protein
MVDGIRFQWGRVVGSAAAFSSPPGPLTTHRLVPDKPKRGGKPLPARSFQELRETSSEELVRAHDAEAEHTVVGVNYFLDELARREAAAQTAAIVKLTLAIAICTAVVTVATIVSTLYVVTH